MHDLADPVSLPLMLKILLGAITLLLSFISALLLIIAWFLREYAKRIEYSINDHEQRLSAIEKNTFPKILSATALILPLLLAGCENYSLPFDGMNIGAQDVTNPCNDHNPCTLDYITWRVDTKTHEHYDSICHNSLMDTCITFCDTASCDDHNPCTLDACVTQDQLCENVDTCATPCDTVPDPLHYDPVLGESFCKLIICGQNTVRSCDDHNLCTNDYCIEGLRECRNDPVNCDDGTGRPYWCDSIYQNNRWEQFCNYGGL